MFSLFWQFAEQFVSFTAAEKQLVQEKFVLLDVPAQHRLVGIGQLATTLYFVNRGCLRFYYLTPEGQEITGFIFEEGGFAGVLESFFTQAPSNQVLETLEECELLALSYADLQHLYDLLPRMNVLVRKVLEQRMAYAQKVVASLILQSPEERYEALLQRQPRLLQRVPQKVLATYLGITPVSLSRIRKRISEKERN